MAAHGFFESSGMAQSPQDAVFPIDAPLRATPALAWDAETDVLVVGFGAAGAAAALSARAAGADVLIAERFQGGGATIKSGGVVYLGGGTRHQQEAGYADTPEAMFRYLREECGTAVSEATLRQFCEGSPALLAWLESLGVPFQSHAAPPKTSYPRDGVYLYYSGNEGVPARAALAAPAPRGHRVRAPGIDSGRELYRILAAQAEQRGAQVWRQAGVRRLIQDERGRVIGAEIARLPPGSKAAAQHRKLMASAETWHNVAPGRADRLRVKARALEQATAVSQRVQARRGVVLTTGGFIFNRAMVAEHAPKYREAMRLGATGCDGSGIRLGASVGGVPTRMEKGSAWRFINPPTAWPKGVVVNREGQRFCNEQVYGATLGVAMCEDHGGRAWLILDKALRRTAMKEALFGKLWFFQSVPAFFQMLFAPRGKTPEALAAKLGLPGPALRQTVEGYTRDQQQGATDALGKSPEMCAPLATPPYFALDISANSKTFPCPTITLGGLKVNEQSGAVLDAQGRDIPGLYAAGRSAVGVASNGYVSGLSIADCLFSGRRAGAAVADSNSLSRKRERVPDRAGEGAP
jgi:3-oxo-5alpha-steroid 4-dehydrogenase